MHSIFLMRNIRSIFLCITVTIATGCENSPTELLLVKPGSPIDSEIAQDIVGLLGNDAEVSILLTDLAQSDEAALVRRQHLWDRFSSGLTECFCSS